MILVKLGFNSQTDFQQNKDWNIHTCQALPGQTLLPDRFPTKQGLKLKNAVWLSFITSSQTDFQQNKDWNTYLELK